MSLPLSAFLIGIWSTGHCLAMCGGLAIAAGQTNRQNLNNTALQRGVELGAWQLGRAFSYAFMGLLAGAFGSFFLANTPVVLIREAAFVMANLILIALGLHVAQVWSGIVQIERIGQVVWKFMAPLASATLVPQTPKRRHPIKQITNALRAGAIWGWLPCGLVYSMLVTASVSGSAANGASWMLAFGLGTLPALWLTSMASDRATGYFQRPTVRKTAGLLIIGFGLWGLLRATGVITVDWLDAFCIGGTHF
ncbi:sulfite exporter TauE/SafE family protein [beta proteobacterium MWH-UniP1]